MAFISVEGHLPGITGLLEYRRDTAQPIRELTQILLRGESTLTLAERELIATLVSNGNQCRFCTAAHTAAADLLLGEERTASEVKKDVTHAPVSKKMKVLLTIADKVRQNGKMVTDELIAKAKTEGATDLEIHDTVLISALFCLYNRYVDGLSTSLPTNNSYFRVLAERLVNHGYMRLPEGYDHLKNQNLKP